MRSIFAKKTVEQILAESEGGEHKLKRTLNVWSLIAIGIGCIIGTGIFVLTGKVAIENSGPGIMLSFIICGVACILAALCYAEFASRVPASGSAYTYAYTSFGEIFAWIIGWALLMIGLINFNLLALKSMSFSSEYTFSVKLTLYRISSFVIFFLFYRAFVPNIIWIIFESSVNFPSYFI